MNKMENKLQIVPINSKSIVDGQEDHPVEIFEAVADRISKNNARTWKEIKKIRDLDESIKEMEVQMEALRRERQEFQLKNRQELRETLKSRPPETGNLAKNTNQYLDLWVLEGNDKLESEFVMNDQKEQSEDMQNVTLEESSPTTDEESYQFIYSRRDSGDSADDTNISRADSIDDLESALNPYSMDESSRKLLKEMEDKLEYNENTEAIVE